MGLLEGRRIVLGIGGGIAAYKAPDLVRRLQEAGATVQAIVTEAGARFVSTLALEAVCDGGVGTDLWRTDAGGGIVHTEAGRDADLILLAPATANLIARLRHGFADDLLSTTTMACRTPVLVAPSMNTEMLDNPLVRENLRGLEALERYTILRPDEGLLACGVTGPGRLPDPPELVEAAAAVLTPSDLGGVRAVVSAGPTREPVDPVRFLSNPSTGAMGFALARALAARGAEVTLVAGPVDRRTPVGVAERVDVRTAAELATAVETRWERTDLLVMAAAVADYRPAEPSSRKRAKGDEDLVLRLERTEDVLRAASARPDRSRRVLLGFAAETHDEASRARRKLHDKGLDWIVANRVGEPGTGFGAADNAGALIGRDGMEIPLPLVDKERFAERIVEHVAADVRGRALGSPRDAVADEEATGG